jgi:hypothetical protein
MGTQTENVFAPLWIVSTVAHFLASISTVHWQCNYGPFTAHLIAHSPGTVENQKTDVLMQRCWVQAD